MVGYRKCSAQLHPYAAYEWLWGALSLNLTAVLHQTHNFVHCSDIV